MRFLFEIYRNRAHRLGLLPHLRPLADPAQLCPHCSAVASVVLRGVELMSFGASLVMGAVISLPRSTRVFFLNSWNVVGTLSLWMYMTRFFFPSIFAITWTFFSFLFVFFFSSFVFRSFLFFFASGPWSVSFFPLHFLPLKKNVSPFCFKKKWFFPVSHSLDYFCKYRNISEKSRLGQLTTSELFRFSL